MLSAVKSAFTTEPTPQTVDPLKYETTLIPVAESHHDAIYYWGYDNNSLLSLKSSLNKVGLDLATLDDKFVTKDGVAYIITKDKKLVARLRAFYNWKYDDSPGAPQFGERKKIKTYKIEIAQQGDKEVYGPVYNDAMNVVKVWASGRAGGKKRRIKTIKRKRSSRKTMRR